jgi:hypothetical protein
MVFDSFAVLGKHKAPFKRIFDGAQTQLRTKFGMEMTELPQKEKVTLKDRRGEFSPLPTQLARRLLLISPTLASGTKVPILILASPRLIQDVHPS